jgi:DMSO/TMAO reductase YedYZ heme-binding membrane subunit
MCFWSCLLLVQKAKQLQQTIICVCFLIFIFVGVLSCVLFLPLLQSENKIIIKELKIGEEIF